MQGAGEELMAARRREQLLDDGFWNEVWYINTYSMFMAYLSMAIKGLGFLVLTWTTVVLLGGFVSALQKKDFWCLTFITLVQTAGIFDAVLNEKLGYVMKSASGMAVGVVWGVVGKRYPAQESPAYSWLAIVLVMIQIVMLGALLLPLVIIYMFGILISGGISLWRLIEHDYRVKSNKEASNMPPAMDTLYYLALLQGLIFCYRFLLRLAKKRLAKRVATRNCDDRELEVVQNYLRETRRGCAKDPSFAKGRNLITHAVDKIGSNSPVDCISGMKILYSAIRIVEKQLEDEEDDRGSENYRDQRDILRGQRMQMKHLVVSAVSSRHILQKLLEALDSRGLHDRETRNLAAVIVERLAFNINLEEFPRGIQHISSLIGTFEQYSIVEPYQQYYLFDEYEQHWKSRARCLPPSPADSDDDASDELCKDYKHLLLNGLCILKKLATDENNCRVMSDTRDLVCKIMAPITSDLLDHTTDDHGEWSPIVYASLEVISLLTGVVGETGTKPRREISGCDGAINTLWRILNCDKCFDELQLNAIRILTQLYMDTKCSQPADSSLKKESSSSNNSREYFVRMLVGIFTHNKYSSSIREYAGGALSETCFRGGTSDVATIVLHKGGGGGDVDSLTKILVGDENKVCRQAAAEILEHLCTRYTKDDKYLEKAMSKVMPKVIKAILCCGDETHTGKEGQQGGFPEQEIDIENPHPQSIKQDKEKVVADGTRKRNESGIENKGDGTQESKGEKVVAENKGDDTQEKGKQDKEEKVFQAVQDSVCSANLMSSLLSLCGTVYDKGFISDLAPQLQASSFVNKLKEMVVKQSDRRRTVENLLLTKTIAKMVISMTKHGGGSFVKQEDFQSLIEALSSASKKMLDVDYSMVFSSPTSATTSSKLDKRCTLVSLVKEAKELHAMAPSTPASG